MIVANATKEVDEGRALQGISVYSYNLTQSGNFLLHVARNGSEINGSPSSLEIASGLQTKEFLSNNLKPNQQGA